MSLEDQQEKVRDNFKLLDQSKTGSGPLSKAHRCVLRSFEPATGAKIGVAQVFCQVGILFRAFGQNPTDEELAEMLRPIPQSGLDVWGSTKMSFLMVSY